MLNLALWHYNFATCAVSLTCSHWQKKKESTGFTCNQILQQLIWLSNTFREEAISEMKASADSFVTMVRTCLWIGERMTLKSEKKIFNENLEVTKSTAQL